MDAVNDVVSWVALFAALGAGVAMATVILPEVHGGWWATGALFVVLVAILIRPFYARERR